jgi:hypothetical protein
MKPVFAVVIRQRIKRNNNNKEPMRYVCTNTVPVAVGDLHFHSRETDLEPCQDYMQKRQISAKATILASRLNGK